MSLFTQIGSVVANAINIEKSGRMTADSNLQTSVTTLTDTVSALDTAYKTADTTLTNAINTQKTRIDTILSSPVVVPFDIAQFINGKPLTGEVLVKVIVPRTVNLPANLSGSYMKSGVAATASTVLTVYKNGTSQGTVTFAAGATTGTISTSAITLNAGDILSVAAPSTVDSTFADFVCVITGSM